MNNRIVLLLSLLLITSSLIAIKPAFPLEAEAKKLTENTWVTMASMHQARADLGVASVNGKIMPLEELFLYTKTCLGLKVKK